MKNYTLIKNTKTLTNQTIDKAVAPVTENITLGYVSSKEHEVSLELTGYLPKLEENKNFGIYGLKMKE